MPFAAPRNASNRPCSSNRSRSSRSSDRCERAAGRQAPSAIQTHPAEDQLDRGKHGVAKCNPDQLVDPVLHASSGVPLAGARQPIQLDEPMRHQVVERADAAVGAHQEPGGEDLVPPVEDRDAAALDRLKRVEVVVGELEADDVRDCAELEDLIGGADRRVDVVEVVHQQRYIRGSRERLVVRLALRRTNSCRAVEGC